MLRGGFREGCTRRNRRCALKAAFTMGQHSQNRTQTVDQRKPKTALVGSSGRVHFSEVGSQVRLERCVLEPAAMPLF